MSVRDWIIPLCFFLLQISSEVHGSAIPYEYNADISENFRLSWFINQTEQRIFLKIDVDSEGWVAFGLSRDGKMVNSDVVVGWVDDNSGIPFLGDYFINGRQGYCPGVCKDDTFAIGGTDDVTMISAYQKDGVTGFEYFRQVTTGDLAGDYRFQDRMQHIVWAYHKTDDGPLFTRHLLTTRGTAKINFFTGEVELPFQMYLVHASLMLIAWMILVPIGLAIALFVDKKRNTWWLRAHRAINSVAVLMVVIAFIVIVTDTATHFSVPHKIIGLVTVILTLFQTMFGIDLFWKHSQRKQDEEKVRRPKPLKRAHWYFGWSAFILAWINIILRVVQDGGAFLILVVVCISVTVLVYLVLMLWKLRNKMAVI